MKHISEWLNCDVCKEIIKTTDRKYILGLLLVTPEDPAMTEEEKESAILNTYTAPLNSAEPGRVQLYDLCPKCLQLFFNLMNMRADDIERERVKVEKMINKKPKTKREE